MALWQSLNRHTLTLILSLLPISGCQVGSSSISSGNGCYFKVPDTHLQAVSLYGAEDLEISLHIAARGPLSEDLATDLSHAPLIFAARDGQFVNLSNVQVQSLANGRYHFTGTLGELDMQLSMQVKPIPGDIKLEWGGKTYDRLITSYGSNYGGDPSHFINGSPLDDLGIVCGIANAGFQLRAGISHRCVGRSLGASPAHLAGAAINRQMLARQRKVVHHLPVRSPAGLAEALVSAPLVRGPPALRAALDGLASGGDSPQVLRDQLWQLIKQGEIDAGHQQRSVPAIWGYSKQTPGQDQTLFREHLRQTQPGDHFSAIDDSGDLLSVDRIDGEVIYFRKADDSMVTENLSQFFTHIRGWYRQAGAPYLDTKMLTVAEHGKIISGKRLGGNNFNPVYLVNIEFEGEGFEFVIKPNSWNEYNDTRYENRFTLLAHQLGVKSVPTTGYRHQPFEFKLDNGEKIHISSGASFQRFEPGAQPVFASPSDTRTYGQMVTDDLNSGKLSTAQLNLDLSDIHVMDLLMGNPDRHGHNILYRNGRLWAIDNAAIGHPGLGLQRGSLDAPGHGHYPVRQIRAETFTHLQRLDRGFFKSWEEKGLMNSGKLDWVMRQKKKILDKICADPNITIHDTFGSVVPKTGC